jgi:hypothetical protein
MVMLVNHNRILIPVSRNWVGSVGWESAVCGHVGI